MSLPATSKCDRHSSVFPICALGGTQIRWMQLSSQQEGMNTDNCSVMTKTGLSLYQCNQRLTVAMHSTGLSMNTESQSWEFTWTMPAKSLAPTPSGRRQGTSKKVFQTHLCPFWICACFFPDSIVWSSVVTIVSGKEMSRHFRIVAFSHSHFWLCCNS